MDKNHIHTYDKNGNITCCSLEEKINKDTTQPAGKEEEYNSDFAHSEGWKEYLPAIISFVLLIAGIVFDNYFHPSFFTGWVRIIWYAVSYAPVGFPVIKEAFETIKKGEFFTEFLLMSLATIGAFIIGQYPEGVAVMLFYAIGELFQSAAVRRAKSNIKALLDIRPDTAYVLRDGLFAPVAPETVEIGETIQIKAGEKVPLDGEMLSERSSFNTAALTGESKPDTISGGEAVLAGMINIDRVVQLKVTRKFEDSSLAKIFYLVQQATQRKARTEKFIRKFAKIYTPVVVYLAIALTFIPYFFIENYEFKDWLYRALIFLVISCPCALVISIPLGYFGGIGAASRKGILFKGSNYLDLMTKVNTVVMDKTGTLTKGVFKVQQVVTRNWDQAEFMQMVAALESTSTHPIAKAIVSYVGQIPANIPIVDVEEISGHGLSGKVAGKELLVGNLKLLDKFNIETDFDASSIVDTIVLVAIEGAFAGYIIIADEIKEDSAAAIKSLHKIGITNIVMLSGDKNTVVQKVAASLGIDQAFGDLLPEQKVEKVEALKDNPESVLAFVGDGINDAPVLAMADVGIAMGGLGSDAAIETADVVIQTDQPSKIATAIQIGKATQNIVWQNIGLAFGVKLVVLILGAAGLATMWEAVFADVGVALLAILNAVRVQRA
jgi:Zn2+/Cd2+-exporting ATPase